MVKKQFLLKKKKKEKSLISTDTCVIQISLKESKVEVPLDVKCRRDSEI